MVGNFLNVFLIIAGVLGTFLVKFIYPRFVKEVLSGVRNIGFISLPLLVLCIFVGSKYVSVPVTVISLCIISACSAIMSTLRSYYSASFAKYGKNGEVAGIINACSSLGIVVQSYGLSKVADTYNWPTVFSVITVLWIIFLVVTSLILPLWKKFKREN